ncbi:MAG: hypothetical protein LKJ43_03430 [Lentilactobacillus buchneri]|jgi:hypothetical protein|nr:hypothetical protein [Lentilactobacillus buchneri]MCI1950764.1 hypothetical protein [Lentilactobacillus buchneri]MCI2019412.1 hypothetical protein [Lentilactobacillus buchneri]MCI2028016.1 hypothetical protein [Lentilactobacillus buchneri]
MNSPENQQEIADGNSQTANEQNSQTNNSSGNSSSLPDNMINPGTGFAHTWKYYGSSKGSSKTEQKLSDEVVSDALFLLTEGGSKVLSFKYGHADLVNYFLGKLRGHLQSTTQVPTYYWWVSTWKDKDSESVYVRHHVKIYSDSSRTNKTADYWDYQIY